jgi:type III secretion protein R
MFMTKLFSFKMGLIALGLLAILWMLPESLISSQETLAFSKTMVNAPLMPVQDQALIAAPDSAKTQPSKMPQKAPIKPKNPTANKTPTTSQSSANALPSPEELHAQRPSLVTQSILLSFMSLLPFIIMILTSFLKVVVVLSLLRTALGVQQAPPNQVINGVAFLLSLFIMYPTGLKMYDATKPIIAQTQAPDSLLSPDSSTYVIAVAQAASEPFREFLKKNSSPKHQALFYRLAYRGLPDEYKESLKPDHFIVLVPSYITGQLKDAFEIGVLIYIPFFVIDLVTSNILLAMGMMMLSPVTISMPLKLFLLVMLDGWTILIEGLVKTFIV